MANKLIGFDLDDTLTHNQYSYSLALAEFVKHTIKTLGPRTPNIRKILEMQSKKDVEAVKSVGFPLERFPTSCADTYLEIAESLGIDGKIGAKKAYEIGAKVFDSTFWSKELIPNTSQTLDYLKKQGDELFLLTIGDPRIQKKKIKFYGLKKWFGDNVYVVPHHKREKLEEIASGRNKENIWFVGNSARSDIAPALEIGIGAVYIPRETWAYDEHDLEGLNQGRLTTLKDIGEIQKNYNQIFATNN